MHLSGATCGMHSYAANSDALLPPPQQYSSMLCDPAAHRYYIVGVQSTSHTAPPPLIPPIRFPHGLQLHVPRQLADIQQSI